MGSVDKDCFLLPSFCLQFKEIIFHKKKPQKINETRKANRESKLKESEGNCESAIDVGRQKSHGLQQ